MLAILWPFHGMVWARNTLAAIHLEDEYVLRFRFFYLHGSGFMRYGWMISMNGATMFNSRGYDSNWIDSLYLSCPGGEKYEWECRSLLVGWSRQLGLWFLARHNSSRTWWLLYDGEIAIRMCIRWFSRRLYSTSFLSVFCVLFHSLLFFTKSSVSGLDSRLR